MKHIHAELMMEYAKDAMETDKPWERWERWEIKPESYDMWDTCSHHPMWGCGSRYRRKQKTISINNIDVPEPYRGKMEVDTEYYIPHLLGVSHYHNRDLWIGGLADADIMRKGLVHLTKEAAKIHGKALASFTEAGDNSTEEAPRLMDARRRTGLLDNNKVRILEGDIIADVDDNTRRYEVTFKNEIYAFKTVPPHVHTHPIFAFRGMDFEVIGNIHQNPELLK